MKKTNVKIKKLKTYKIKHDEYHKLNITLCKKLKKIYGNDLKDSSSVIFGVSRGGLIPAVYISQYFNIPLKGIFLKSYLNMKSCNLMIEENLPGFLDLKLFKNIILVDDIVDTGNTFNFLTKYFNFLKELHNLNFQLIKASLISAYLNNPVDCVSKVFSKNIEWIVFPYEKVSK